MKKKNLTGMLMAVFIAIMLTGCSDTGNININYNENEEVDEEEKAQLEYWTEDSKAASSITEYVNKVTDEDSESYIPVEDRIAVFDLDGTIIGELYPSYFEYMMFIHRALYDENYEADEEVKEFAAALEEGIRTGSLPDNSERIHAEYAGRVYAGMTIDELYNYAVAFGNIDTSSFEGMKYRDGFYLPMVELVKYLYENDFTIYVVSGTERTTTRAIVANSPISEYVSPAHVIGTEFEVKQKG